MAEEERRERRSTHRLRRIALASLAAVFAVAGAGYAAYWAKTGRFRESTDDAYVAGNRVPVMAEVHGTVVALMADNTMPVRRAQAIVRLDDTDARVALQQAEAKLASAVRRIQGGYAKAKQLEADVETRKASLALAQHEYGRDRHLHARGYYPTRSLEQSATSLEVERHELVSARQALNALRAELGDTDIARHPDVKLAAAELRDAYLDLERTRIVAPVSGFVANRNVQVGQQIDPGPPLMAIVPADQVWVDANFKESQLDRIRVGQAVVMYSDAYGRSVAFHGRVIGIAKADVERHRLQIGLSMKVSVDTRDLADPSDSRPVIAPAGYTTEVYDSRAADADNLIARIVAENSGQEGGVRETRRETGLRGTERENGTREARQETDARETGQERRIRATGRQEGGRLPSEDSALRVSEADGYGG
jgi:membrane fusion protein (multidrug efflux system)